MQSCDPLIRFQHDAHKRQFVIPEYPSTTLEGRKHVIRRKLLIFFCLCAVSVASLLPLFSQQTPVSFLIVNAQIADGTGAPLRKASVRVALNHIIGIGELTPEKAEPVIDAKGLVLAPGFIDIHNHSAEGILDDPLSETQIAQGITSLVVGPDGESPWPIIQWVRPIQQLHTAPNVAIFAGHATIREQVMGKDYKRLATPQEIQMMQQLMSQAMNQQALGLSSGLEYEVGSYSNTDELVALSKVAAAQGGIYMTHIRDEADKSFEALNEEIAIGERAHIPVEHSHIKLGTVGVQGKAAAYIKVIEEARNHGVDFMADCYPYDAWHANLKVLVPDKQYENPKSLAKALADVGGASHITITQFKPNPAYAGNTLADLAKAAHLSDVNMFIRLIREGDAANEEASIICQSMLEADIKAFYQQPWVMVASDGGIGNSHPRGAGTFPRVLGVYVREKHWLTLPEAIRKMTSLPAQRLGWKDRGVIREGAFADLVLLNPDTVIDRSTYTNPAALPTGIEKVFVNGVLVWDNAKSTSARPGFFLGRAGAPIEILN
jgi:N-acyl-D-amino-acid deacylase